MEKDSFLRIAASKTRSTRKVLMEALSVPDDDPLQFYRAIAEYGVQTLSDEGVLYFETNPLYINK